METSTTIGSPNTAIKPKDLPSSAIRVIDIPAEKATQIKGDGKTLKQAFLAALGATTTGLAICFGSPVIAIIPVTLAIYGLYKICKSNTKPAQLQTQELKVVLHHPEQELKVVTPANGPQTTKIETHIWSSARLEDKHGTRKELEIQACLFEDKEAGHYVVGNTA